MKNWLLCLAFLLNSTFALATEQVIVSGSLNSTTSSTEYHTLVGGTSWNATEINREALIPTGGAFSGLKVTTYGNAPGTGDTRIFTLRINGADSDLTCTISGAVETSCEDITHSVAVVATDNVTIENTPTGSPDNDAVNWSLTFTPTVTQETILIGSSGGVNVSINDDQAMHGRQGGETFYQDVQTLFPTAGTLKKLYVELEAAPGAGNSFIFTVLDSTATATDVTCTIANTATTCNDVSHTQAILAGERYNLGITGSGTPTESAAQHGIVFLTDTAGEFLISACGDANSGANTTQYLKIQDGDANWRADANAPQLASEMTIKNMYAHISNAPGAGESFALTLYQNAGDSALTCTVADAAQTCTAASDISVSDLDTFMTKNVTSAGIASADPRIAYLGYIDPGTPAGAPPQIW